MLNYNINSIQAVESISKNYYVQNYTEITLFIQKDSILHGLRSIHIIHYNKRKD